MDIRERIEALREMEAKATKGPWWVDLYYLTTRSDNKGNVIHQSQMRKGSPTVRCYIDREKRLSRNVCQVGYGNHARANDDRRREEEAEAALIAASRNSLKELLDLAELAVEARPFIADLEEVCEGERAEVCDWIVRLDALAQEPRRG